MKRFLLFLWTIFVILLETYDYIGDALFLADTVAYYQEYIAYCDGVLYCAFENEHDVQGLPSEYENLVREYCLQPVLDDGDCIYYDSAISCLNYYCPDNSTNSKDSCDFTTNKIRIPPASRYIHAGCKCFVSDELSHIMSDGRQICDVPVIPILVINVVAFFATTVMEGVLLVICIAGLCGDQDGKWFRLSVVRCSFIAPVFVLLRPATVIKWNKEIEENSYRLEILFSVFEDLPQLVAAVMLARALGDISLFTLLSLIGSGLSLLVQFGSYLKKVYERVEDMDIELN